MKHVMLIFQGDAQERQAALPEAEQEQVYADYQAINAMPGVRTVPPLGVPENATTVRVEGGRTLTTDGPFVGMKEAVGGVFVLAIWGVVWACGLAVAARRAAEGARGEALLATGVVASLVVQVVLNVAGVLNVLPMTGITLPLISHGGSSLAVTLVLFGVLLGVARRETGSGT